MNDGISRFFSQCKEWLGHGSSVQAEPKDLYEKLLQNAMERIERNPRFYASIFADQELDRILRDEEQAEHDREHPEEAASFILFQPADEKLDGRQGAATKTIHQQFDDLEP